MVIVFREDGRVARVGRGLQERFTRAPVVQPGMPRSSWLEASGFAQEIRLQNRHVQWFASK